MRIYKSRTTPDHGLRRGISTPLLDIPSLVHLAGPYLEDPAPCNLFQFLAEGLVSSRGLRATVGLRNTTKRTIMIGNGGKKSLQTPVMPLLLQRSFS
jgi:hypothetical protein